MYRGVAPLQLLGAGNRWGWVFGRLVAALVGGLHFQFVEQNRRAYDAVGNVEDAVVDEHVVARGNDVVAQGMLVEAIEGCTAHQFLASILHPNSIEQRGSRFRIGGLDIVAIVETPFLAKLNQLLL